VHRGCYGNSVPLGAEAETREASRRFRFAPQGQ